MMIRKGLALAALVLVSVPMHSAYSANTAVVAREAAIEAGKLMKYFEAKGTSEMLEALRKKGMLSEAEIKKASESPAAALEVIKAKDAALEKLPSYRTTLRQEVGLVITNYERADVVAARQKAIRSESVDAAAGVRMKAGFTLGTELSGGKMERRMKPGELEAVIADFEKSGRVIDPAILDDARRLAGNTILSSGFAGTCKGVSDRAVSNALQVEVAGARVEAEIMRVAGQHELTVAEWKAVGDASVAKLAELKSSDFKDAKESFCALNASGPACPIYLSGFQTAYCN